MNRRFAFSLSALFLIVSLVAGLIAIIMTWTTQSMLIGVVVSFVAALTSVLTPKSFVPKGWRLTLWITFIAQFIYIASIGPSAWLVATINRPGVRSPLAKKFFMEAYSPISDVLISGPDGIRSFGCSYIRWWLPRHASISQHEGVGIILRQEYKSGIHGETYLCVLSQALH